VRVFPNTTIVGLCAALIVSPHLVGAQAQTAKPMQTAKPTPTPTSTVKEMPTAARQPANLGEARVALEGKWTLASMTAHATDGRSARIDAAGTLISDFSNLTIEFRISPRGLEALNGLGIKAPNPVIATSGRVVIDTQKALVTYASDDINRKMLGFDPELAKLRSNPFSLERTRSYLFSNDGTLRMATKYDDGKDALVSVWKRN
jgi:hypothetical protein